MCKPLESGHVHRDRFAVVLQGPKATVEAAGDPRPPSLTLSPGRTSLSVSCLRTGKLQPPVPSLRQAGQ